MPKIKKLETSQASLSSQWAVVGAEDARPAGTAILIHPPANSPAYDAKIACEAT